MQINLLYAYFTVNMNLGYHFFLVRGRESEGVGLERGLGRGMGSGANYITVMITQ